MSYQHQVTHFFAQKDILVETFAQNIGANNIDQRSIGVLGVHHPDSQGSRSVRFYCFPLFTRNAKRDSGRRGENQPRRFEK